MNSSESSIDINEDGYSREEIAGLLVAYGLFHKERKEFEKAIAAYDETVRRFGNDDSPDIRICVAGALAYKIDILKKQGRDGDAIALYDEIIQRFSDDDSSFVREQVSLAFINKAATLRKLGDDRDVIYDETIQRLGNDNSPAVREQAVQALLEKVLAIWGNIRHNHYEGGNRTEEIVTLYNEIVRRFGNDDSPGVREQVAKAGMALSERGWDEEKTVIYNEIIRHFGDDDASGVHEIVAALWRR